MAGQAQKKAARAASASASFYGNVILVVNLTYALWLALQYSRGTARWSDLAAWPLTRKATVAGLTAGFYWWAYQGVVNAAASKLSASTYIDLLGLTAIAQLGSIVTNYAWGLYYLVPVAVVVKYVLPLLGMFGIGLGSGSGEASDPAADAAEAKRLAKKERKAQKPRIIR